MTLQTVPSPPPPRKILRRFDAQQIMNVLYGEKLQIWRGLTPALNQLPCKNCLTNKDIIEDVQEGHVVCTQCGMIQRSGVMETALTNAQFHTGLSRDVVHHYSRWTYLRSIIQANLGETQIEISEEHKQLFLDHGKEIDEFSVTTVKSAIKKHKLPYRLVRHSVTIATQLWPKSTRHLLSVGQSELAKIARRFREYESVWDSDRSANCKLGRRFFLNYRLLWSEIVKEKNYPHLDFFKPLKNNKLHVKQLAMVKSVRDLIPGD